MKPGTGRISWRFSNLMYVIAVVAALTAVASGLWTVLGIFFGPTEETVMDLDYGSVLYETGDEKYETGSPLNSVEIFGRLNWKFSQQKNWYGEMSADIDMSIATQHVETYKQFSGGMLISADLSTGLVNGASQFCYLPDSESEDMGIVVWRKPAEEPPYHGIDTEWQAGDPYRSMTIRDFKSKNGLPAYELSVYVIRPETVLSSEEVTENGDGTWTVVYHLNPEVWESEDGTYVEGATSYYGNQMKFSSGGVMKEAPSFNSIRISFTFDAEWQVLSSDVLENYTAVYGVPVSCTYHSHTEYQYDTPKAESTAYEEYFSDHTDTVSGDEEEPLTATDCLISMATGLLGRPVSLAFTLDYGDASTDGVLYLDTTDFDISSIDMENLDLEAIASQLDVRIRIGDALNGWLNGSRVYLAYGPGVKGNLEIGEFADLISRILEMTGTAEGYAEAEEDPDGGNAFLAAITEGEFTAEEGYALLHADLPVFGALLPVDFGFLLDDKNNATLDTITLRTELGEERLYFELGLGEEVPPALEEGAKGEYPPLIPRANDILDLLLGSVIHADLGYTVDDLRLEGFVDLNLELLTVQGELTVRSLSDASLSKTARFGLRGDIIYADLDGVKVSLSLMDAASLLSGYLTLPGGGGLSIEIDTLVATLLDPAFLSNLRVTGDENALSVAAKGTELLRGFGINFDLGDIALSVSAGRIDGALLGLDFHIAAGSRFTVDNRGYTDLGDAAKTLRRLFEGQALSVTADTAAGALSVHADLTLSLETGDLAGDLLLMTAGAQKRVGLLVTEGNVYVDLDGIRMRAAVAECVELLGAYLDLPDGGNEEDLLTRILSLDFGALLSLEGGDDLTVTLKGGELLAAFGISFDLGDVQAVISDRDLTLSAMGIRAVVSEGTSFALPDLSEYFAVLPHVRRVISLLGEDAFAIGLSYASGGVGVQADLSLAKEPMALGGAVTLTYGGIRKSFNVYYGEDILCLSVDGVRVKTDLPGAVAFLSAAFGEEGAPALPETEELLATLLSLDFGDLLGVTAQDDSLRFAVQGTMLLEALGYDFDLGTVGVGVEEGRITATALGISASVTAGEAPVPAQTEDYIDLLPYAQTVYGLIEGDNLQVTADYATENLSVRAELMLSLSALAAEGDVTVSYRGAEKTVHVLYADGLLYLTLDGIKLSANAADALSMIMGRLGIDRDPSEEERDLLASVLSLDLGALLGLSEEDDVLTAAVDGSLLLEALGYPYDLGTATLTLENGGGLSLSVKGATLSVEGGDAFELSARTGYIDVLPYAASVLALLDGEALQADVRFIKGDVNLGGTVMIDLSTYAVSADLTLGYLGTEKAFAVLLKDGAVYLDVEGLRVSADVARAVQLVTRYTGAAEVPEAEDLLSRLFEMTFDSPLLTLREEDDSLTLALQGTELLAQLGIDVALGDVTVTLGKDAALSASLLGASVTVTAGNAFAQDTAGYLDLTDYAYTVADLIDGRYLEADLRAEGVGLTAEGTLLLDLGEAKNPILRADLTLTYQTVSKALSLAYVLGENACYLEAEGFRFKATLPELIDFISAYVTIPEGSDTQGMLTRLFSLSFGDLLALTERGDELTLTVETADLLAALGAELDLGRASLSVNRAENTLSAQFSGGAAELDLRVRKGAPFEVLREGIEILPYAQTVADLIAGNQLSAAISYHGLFDLEGTLDLSLSPLAAQGNFTLTYGTAHSLSFGYLGKEDRKDVFLDADGLKVRAEANEAMDFLRNFFTLPALPEDNLLLRFLSLDLSEYFTLTESESTLTLAAEGTLLLSALFDSSFDLGTVTVAVREGEVQVSAADATVTLRAGAPFTVREEGADIVKYARYVYDIVRDGLVRAEVEYTGGGLTVNGSLDLSFKDALALQGAFTLTYQGTPHTLYLAYTSDEEIYLSADGIRVTANRADALAFLGQFVDLTPQDVDAKALLEKLLSVSLSDLAKIGEEGDTFTLLLHTAELLSALGLQETDLSDVLGDISVKISEDGIRLTLGGADLTLTKGAAFRADTDGYAELLPYAQAVYDLIRGNVLSADLSYAHKQSGVTVEGDLLFDLQTLTAAVDLTLTYKSAVKHATVLYLDGTAYLTFEGMHLKGSAEEIAALLSDLLPNEEIAARTLLEKVLSVDLGTLLSLSEDKSQDTLSVVLKTQALFSLLGVSFEDLGDIALSVRGNTVSAQATLSGGELQAAVTSGPAFSVVPVGNYIDAMPYVNAVKTFIDRGNTDIIVTFEKGNFSLAGKICLAFSPEVRAAADLTLSYASVENQIAVSVVYGDGCVYLRTGGVKVKANAKEGADFLLSLLGTGEDEERDLLEELLSLDLDALTTLQEDENGLTLMVNGTELLASFGMKKFALGDVKIIISEREEITLSVLNVTLCAGKGSGVTLPDDLSDYPDILPYVQAVYDLIQSNYISAAFRYEFNEITVIGTLDFDISARAVRLSATITCGGVRNEIAFSYGADEVVCLTVGNAKVRCALADLKTLLGDYLALPKADADEILSRLFDAGIPALLTSFGEKDGTLQAAISGKELLQLFAADFDLGDIAISLSQAGDISLDANILSKVMHVDIRKGESFTLSSEGYLDLYPYAAAVKTLLQSDYLEGIASYTYEGLAIEVTSFKLALERDEANAVSGASALAELNLSYKGTALPDPITVAYAQDGTIYVRIGAIKLLVTVDELTDLLAGYVSLPKTEVETYSALKTFLSKNLKALFAVGMKGDALHLAVDGTTILEAFGIDFSLGRVTVDIREDSIRAKATLLGNRLWVDLRTGTSFSIEEEGIPVAAYAKSLMQLFESDFLKVTLNYSQAAADGSAQARKWSLDGSLTFALSADESGKRSFTAQGAFTVAYGKAEKRIELGFADGIVYLALTGSGEGNAIRIRARLTDAIRIVKEFITIDDITLDQIIQAVFTVGANGLVTNLEEFKNVEEQKSVLSATFALKDLLKQLDFPFEIEGELSPVIGIGKSGSITFALDALGGTFGGTLSAATEFEFTPSKDDYLDIIPFADAIVKIAKGEGIRASVTYTRGDFSVKGDFDLSFSPLAVSAELTLSYAKSDARRGFEKKISVAYGNDGTIYLTIDELHLKANAKEASGLLTSLMGGKKEDRDLLEEVLSLDFTQLVQKLGVVKEEETSVLQARVAMNELLTAFGITLDLGDVSLELTDGGALTLTAGEITVTAEGADKMQIELPDPDAYTDLTPVFESVKAILSANVLQVKGSFELEVNGSFIVFDVCDGYLSLPSKDAHSLAFYLKGELAVGTVALPIELRLDVDLPSGGDTNTDTETNTDTDTGTDAGTNTVTGTLTFAYSGVLVQLGFDKLSTLEEAFVSVYNRVRDFVRKTLVGGGTAEENANPLPEIKGISDLLGALRGGEQGMAALSDFDWTALVADVTLNDYVREDGLGILALKCGALCLYLSRTDVKGDLAVLHAEYQNADGKLTYLAADLAVKVIKDGKVPPLGDEEALKAEALADLLDYVGAAVGLLEQNDLTVSFGGLIEAESYVNESGKTVSYPKSYVDPDGETKEHERGVRYAFDGSVSYNAGDNDDTGLPFHLDRKNKNFYVDSDIFLKLTFNLRATTAADTSVYLEIVALDSDMSGQQNNYLDFYITASTVGAGKEGYDPLRVYVSGDEILTVLAGVFEVLGVDTSLGEQLGGVLTDYFIAPWMSIFAEGMEGVDTQEILARLKTLGESLLHSLGSTGEEPADGTDSGSDDGADSGADSGTDEPLPEQTTPAVRNYIKSASREEGKFELVLSGEDLFGSGAQDLKITLEKRGEAGSSVLTSLALSAPAGGSAFALNMTFDSQTPVDTTWETPACYPNNMGADDGTMGYFPVSGAKELIIALANTATHGVTAEGARAETHEQADHYVREENFYIDGSISLKANLSFIPGLSLVNYDIQDLAVEVIFDENAKVGLKLHYMLPRLHEVVDIINADTEVDFMLNGGMVFIKRVVTTDKDGKALPAPEVIYRAMPLENFSKTALEQINFMFNFGSTISNAITGGSGGGTTTSESQDIGTLFRSYVKGCSYTPAANGDHKWQLVINGETLTKDVNQVDLHEITVDLGLQEKLIRTLGLQTSVSLAGLLNADVEGNLRLRNPQGLMDEGVEKKTQDIETPMRGGMADAIESTVWTEKDYLEGEYTEVTYMLGEDEIGKPQGIFFDRATKQFYTSLKYPELTEEQIFGNLGYTLRWKEISPEDYKPGMTVYTEYVANTYHITFESEIAFEGATQGKDGLWRGELDWTYLKSDPNDPEIPYRFTFPADADGKRRIVGFTYNGEKIDDLTGNWEFLRDLENGATLTFTASYEGVIYTVTFDVNGTDPVTGKYDDVTGQYDETIPYPDTENTKTGYTFEKWSEEPKTFGEIWETHGHATELTITANYTPNVYTVTLVSDHMITFDGFEFEQQSEGEFAGKYVATLQFTYDSKVELPKNLEHIPEMSEESDNARILTGFRKGDSTYSDYIPNITEDSTFTAVWELDESMIRIKFVAIGEDEKEDVVATRYGHVEDTLTQDMFPKFSEFPDKLQKNGYRGYWSLNGKEFTGDYVVEEKFDADGNQIKEFTFIADYEANTYTVTVRSEHPVAEFEQKNGYFIKTYSYIFDSEKINPEKVVVLTTGLETSGYDCVGYDLSGLKNTEKYSDENGNVTINSALIEAFGYKDGTLNIIWKNNKVKVIFYSDFEFDGSTKTDNKLNYASKTFSGNYDISKETLTPTTKNDIQQLGWWYQDGDTWRNVTNVQEFVSENTDESTVSLYAMWIQNIVVTLTNLQPDNPDRWATYSFAGTSTGGDVIGAKSDDIYKTAGITKEMTAKFIIYISRSSGGYNADELKGGDSFTLGDDGAFSVGPLTSGYSFVGDGAEYGGVYITLTFSYTGSDKKTHSVSTDWNAAVSYKKYLVRVIDNGVTLKEEYYRDDFDETLVTKGVTFSKNYDNWTYVRDVLKGIELEKEGYQYLGLTDGSGNSVELNSKITGAMDIYINRDVEYYEYTLRVKGHQFDGWTPETDSITGADTGYYIKTLNVYYDAMISIPANNYEAYDNKKIGECFHTGGTWTIENAPLVGKRIAQWESFVVETDENGICTSIAFTTKNEPDTVNYRSVLAFAYKGEHAVDESGYATYSETFDTKSYELLIPDGGKTTFEGVTYTFVGWFEDMNGSWTWQESIPLSEDGRPRTFEALWMSELKIEVTTSRNNYGREQSVFGATWWQNDHYTYDVTATVQGGEFVGAFAAEITKSMTYSIILHHTKASWNLTDRDKDTTIAEGEANGSEISIKDYTGQNNADWDTAKVQAALDCSYNGKGFSLKDVLVQKGITLSVEGSQKVTENRVSM